MRIGRFVLYCKFERVGCVSKKLQQQQHNRRHKREKKIKKQPKKKKNGEDEEDVKKGEKCKTFIIFEQILKIDRLVRFCVVYANESVNGYLELMERLFL